MAGGIPPLDPATVAVLRALETQSVILRGLADRMQAARSAVPEPDRGEWRGPVRAAFDAEVRQLDRLAGIAIATIERARSSTERAIATMSGGR